MSHTPHELHEEFPETADRILAVKTSARHFTRRADAYHHLNRDIHRAESDIEPSGDAHLEEMKKQRLTLTDDIFARLDA
jgi:uncharacterized protein YdcH (DUF465 family)